MYPKETQNIKNNIILTNNINSYHLLLPIQTKNRNTIRKIAVFDSYFLSIFVICNYVLQTRIFINRKLIFYSKIK
jgi:hypothetical protein